MTTKANEIALESLSLSELEEVVGGYSYDHYGSGVVTQVSPENEAAFEAEYCTWNGFMP